MEVYCGAPAQVPTGANSKVQYGFAMLFCCRLSIFKPGISFSFLHSMNTKELTQLLVNSLSSNLADKTKHWDRYARGNVLVSSNLPNAGSECYLLFAGGESITESAQCGLASSLFLFGVCKIIFAAYEKLSGQHISRFTFNLNAEIGNTCISHC